MSPYPLILDSVVLDSFSAKIKGNRLGISSRESVVGGPGPKRRMLGMISMGTGWTDVGGRTSDVGCRIYGYSNI